MINPTLKKVRRAGYVPIRYRSPDAAYNRWITDGELGDSTVRVELVAYDRAFRLGIEEQAFVTKL